MFSISASSSRSRLVGVAHERRHLLELGHLRRAQAPLAGDQLVLAAGQRADDERLEDAARLDRLGQRDQRLAAELLARLVGVRPDQLDRDLAQARSRRDATAAGSRRGRGRSRGGSIQARAATSLASFRYATEPGQSGSCCVIGTPWLGASPMRTLRGMTVSKTSSGKCCAHLALDVLREARAAVVHRQDHPGDAQPRVELALDEPERVEQAGQALEREVLGLHRHDHLVGRDERVDGERPERRRAVEQREEEAAAHRAHASR